jgi:phosphoribosylaminoimidazolecarboxamide formyltransferase / IMP cyclohydrolase
MKDLVKIKRALISVSDKSGILEFARELQSFGVEIISTGGTCKSLRESGLNVTEVADITGFPEMMDGRVKTLHPKIHGAFLALRENEKHVASMEEHSITPIDLVVVNLYPFQETIAKEEVTLAEAIEQIDIGGPAMIRSASKNFQSVAVVTDANLYADIISELKKHDGSLTLNTRQCLATLAYTRTASYDLAISSYLSEQLSDKNLTYLEPFNPLGNVGFFEFNEDDDENDFIELSKISDLRYGENPHQKATLFSTGETSGIAKATQLHGKEMSFNNYVDADAAWNLVNEFQDLACAIIKHTNPSGVGLGETPLAAYERALATDSVSAFGGIVAFNRKVDAKTANEVVKVFTEVVIAPEFDAEAIEIFKSKKNLRVLQVDADSTIEGLEYKQISGGMLAQSKDIYRVSENDLKFVTEKKPTESEVKAMLFAWKVCKHTKSNAIVFANEFNTLGVGAGQMNRVDSVRIAGMRAERFNFDLKGSVVASDAFFPFRDNVDECAAFGVSAIIQPGGSLRDDEVIEAANEFGIAMAFTGFRHFKH